MALKCTSCSCGFCAICLKDCGTDAHKHLEEGCKLAEDAAGWYTDDDHHCNEQGERRGGLFCSKALWDEVLGRQVKVLKLRGYLRGLEGGVAGGRAQHAVARVRVQLNQLMMRPEQFEVVEIDD